MEEYRRVKFKLKKLEQMLPDGALRKFLGLDSKLKEFIGPGQNEGNMSTRHWNGFLIKRAGAMMGELGGDDVSCVLRADEEVAYTGAEPSSEARMHARIYEKIPDANIILHFHDDEKLAGYSGPSIGPYGYGTRELADAAAAMAAQKQEFMIKEHGFVIIAKDENELIQRLLSWKK
jgi:ribulose-5-phosphate 4-epimerase/fuculose-1-phosphate aldolase